MVGNGNTAPVSAIPLPKSHIRPGPEIESTSGRLGSSTDPQSCRHGRPHHAQKLAVFDPAAKKKRKKP